MRSGDFSGLFAFGKQVVLYNSSCYVVSGR
jgi:hypothetical protein